MSNSEPSAIVLQGIFCMGGLYKLGFELEKTVHSRFAAIGRRHSIWRRDLVMNLVERVTPALHPQIGASAGGHRAVVEILEP